MSKKTQIGFSLLELLIVIAISMILMAIAAPLVRNGLNVYYLREAGANFANLLQNARQRAEQDDAYYNVVTTTSSCAATNYVAYVNTALDQNNCYQAADPAMVAQPPVVIMQRAAAPNVNNLESQYLPNPGSVAINPTANSWGPSFNQRGLPCQALAPIGSFCTAYSSPGGLPVAFEVFFQNTRTQAWEAVTLNPAGRVRTWYYETGSNTWVAHN